MFQKYPKVSRIIKHEINIKDDLFRISEALNNQESFGDELAWQLRSLDYDVYEKMDGSNVCLEVYHCEEFEYMTFQWFSRSGHDLTDLGGQYTAFLEQVAPDVEPKMESLVKYLKGSHYLFYGEAIGPKLNGNRHKLDHFEWRIFDIYDCDKQRWFNHQALELLQGYNLQSVPIFARNLDLEYALFCHKRDTTGREGFIVRPTCSISTQSGVPVKFKIK